MGIELVFPVHRRGERQRSQRAHAAEAAEHSHPARDPERIGPPHHQQHRDRQHDREPHLPGEPGDDDHQEGERGEVDDHDVDERRRHHEDIVLELRQRDQDDDQRQRQRCRRHRPPQQDQPEEIEQAPGENESRPCRQVGLGPDQQACGGQLHRGKDRDGAETPAIGGREVLFQIDDGRRHDGCQGRALATSPARRLSSFCNKAVMARAWAASLADPAIDASCENPGARRTCARWRLSGPPIRPGAEIHCPAAALFTKRSSKVFARSMLAPLSSSSKASSMSAADFMPAAGITPVSE